MNLTTKTFKLTKQELDAVLALIGSKEETEMDTEQLDNSVALLSVTEIAEGENDTIINHQSFVRDISRGV